MCAAERVLGQVHRRAAGRERVERERAGERDPAHARAGRRSRARRSASGAGAPGRCARGRQHERRARRRHLLDAAVVGDPRDAVAGPRPHGADRRVPPAPAQLGDRCREPPGTASNRCACPCHDAPSLPIVTPGDAPTARACPGRTSPRASGRPGHAALAIADVLITVDTCRIAAEDARCHGVPICGHLPGIARQKLAGNTLKSRVRTADCGANGPAYLGAPGGICQSQEKDSQMFKNHEAPDGPGRRGSSSPRRSWARTRSPRATRSPTAVRPVSATRRSPATTCRTSLHAGPERPVDLVVRRLRPLGRATQVQVKLDDSNTTLPSSGWIDCTAGCEHHPARLSVARPLRAPERRRLGPRHAHRRSLSVVPYARSARGAAGTLLPPPRCRSRRDVSPPHTPPSPLAPTHGAWRRRGRTRCGVVLPRPARPRRRHRHTSSRRDQHAAAVPHR